MVKKNVKTTPVVEETVEQNQVENNESVVSLAIKELYDVINEQKAWHTKITNQVKNLEKMYRKLVKENTKNMKKKNMKVKRSPSGFAKPTSISKELCDFLQKPIGTEMARTEVTKYLTQYIKEHKLQFEEDKRKIKPDTKLKKLLNLKKDDEVTYFNLQKYMKPHFESAANKVSAGSSM